jgi:hypothetical protein
VGTSEIVRIVLLENVGRCDVGRVGGKEFVDHNALRRPVISEAMAKKASCTKVRRRSKRLRSI